MKLAINNIRARINLTISLLDLLTHGRQGILKVLHSCPKMLNSRGREQHTISYTSTLLMD